MSWWFLAVATVWVAIARGHPRSQTVLYYAKSLTGYCYRLAFPKI
jgi:hypothetical protein